MPILKFEGMQHHANESTTIKSSRFSVGFQETRCCILHVWL